MPTMAENAEVSKQGENEEEEIWGTVTPLSFMENISSGRNIADCALTKYCFPAKFASSRNILFRHNISIFLHFVPTQYCVER